MSGEDDAEDREAILSRRRMLVAAALAGLASAACDSCEPAPQACLQGEVELIPMPPQLPPPPPAPPPPPPVMVTPEPQEAEPPPAKRTKRPRRPPPTPPRPCLSMPRVCLSYIEWHADDDDD